MIYINFSLFYLKNMEITKNKQLSKTRFYNTYRGSKDTGYFFYMPTIAKSPKKILNWDTCVFSIFFMFGKHYIQFNIYERIKDSNLEVVKENMVALLSIMKSAGLKITDISMALEFLNNNPYLVLILKNSNVTHPYVKNIVVAAVQNQPFVTAL